MSLKICLFKVSTEPLFIPSVLNPQRQSPFSPGVYVSFHTFPNPIANPTTEHPYMSNNI